MDFIQPAPKPVLVSNGKCTDKDLEPGACFVDHTGFWVCTSCTKNAVVPMSLGTVDTFHAVHSS